MRFAEAHWLWGLLVALAVLLFLIWGGFLHQRAVRRFGDPELVLGLKTAKTGVRRALRGALLVLALALLFVAAAQPQYGRGTRLIPATNLDVVIVLDFSKSMYARDVSPSRIARAKVEVAELVRELPGARFGGVAFAGSPMSFPLTSDGAAVAQFFRGLEPNDMPLGGTAIARALDAARQLLERDPKSAQHERVVVLVTDGEDLEGDPAAVAEAMAKERIRVHVVQIGGRSPEPIPDVDEHGQVRGLRQDSAGQLLMTSLSAEGEAQLARIASVAQGQLVRAAKGTTGVQEITRELRRLMTDELSEQVETIYADVYGYPLGLAIVLLVIESLIGTAPARRLAPAPAEPPRRSRRKRRKRLVETATALLLGTSSLGCQTVDETLDTIFQRYSPEVDAAIAELEQRAHESAVQRLIAYLETGACEAGVIGTPDRVRARPNAAFDLALGLFGVAESLGPKFVDPPPSVEPGAAGDPNAEARKSQIECALRLIAPVGLDTSLPVELRARAHYLAGNLHFLQGDYRAAVTAYDAALRLVPGRPAPEQEVERESDDPLSVGRRAAHNRAVALRRLAEQPPEENQNDSSSDDDKSDDDKGDQNDDANDGDSKQDQDPKDQGDDPSSEDPQRDPEDQDGQDSQKPEDQDKDKDQGKDGDESPSDASSEPPEQPAAPRAAQDDTRQLDERLLDELERAPSFQEQDARQNARRIRGRTPMEDK